jgi:pimeloyl-ACP methyl ester carboxylesterase
MIDNKRAIDQTSIIAIMVIALRWRETMASKTTKILAATAAAAAIATASVAHPADKIADSQAVRNVVLVHGAFADGSGWRGVYDELMARGYRVSIVQNPLTSLADDVAATKRVLDRQQGPTVLVGHSWGGTVITEAGVHPNVASLVYVSALSPDAGQTTGQLYEGYQTPPEFVIETTPDGYGFIAPDTFKIGFANDTTDSDAAFMRDSQVPVNLSAFGTKLEHAAWRSKPSWAVIATDDRAFDQHMLQDIAKRIGAKVTEVAASHAVFMTQPKVVADVIDEAARQGTVAAR